MNGPEITCSAALLRGRDGSTVSTGRICVSILPASVAEAQRSLARAFAATDLVELRLDHLGDEGVVPLVGQRAGQLIVTDRAAREGGLSGRTDLQRVERLSAAVAAGADGVDLELSCAPELIAALRARIRHTGRATALILSFHDLRGTPERADLEAKLRCARDLGADIVKITCTATCEADSQRVLDLHGRARQLKQPLVAFCVGEIGRSSRILALRLGSVFGFASLERGAESASGQWPVAAMRDLLERIGAASGDETTARYAVVGRPVRHSLSPLMFRAAFLSLGLKAEYDLREVDDAAVIAELVRSGALRGASVTLPYKSAILPWLDDVDADARRIGAVNTVWMEAGRLRGTNTDWVGLARCLRDRVDLRGLRVAVVGAGGAARAAVHAIQQGGGEATVLCRDARRGEALAADLGCAAAPLAEVERVDATGLVNATPVGLAPLVDTSPLPATALARFSWVLDLVYVPQRTRLLADAEAAGCLAIGGLAMLVDQAAAQFTLWTGRTAPRDLMAAVAGEALAWSAR